MASHPRVQWTRQRVVIDRLLVLSGGRLKRRRLLVRVDHDLVVVSRRRGNGLLLLLLLLVVMRTEVAEVRLLLLLLLLMVRLGRRCRVVVLLMMMVPGGCHLLLMMVGHVDHVRGTGRFDQPVGHRGLELARGVHDRCMTVHGHLAHSSTTTPVYHAIGRFGPAVAVHGRLVVIGVVARRGGRLSDFHPVVRRKTRVRHALGRLSADGGPAVMVRRYALPGSRVTRRVVHVMLLAVVVMVHDHAATSADAAADAATATAEYATATAAVPHVGWHVRIGKVRTHVQQVTAIALHFAGRNEHLRT